MPLTGYESSGKDYQFLWFSQLFKRRVCAEKISERVGRVSDLVFQLKEPYPEAVGIFVDHHYSRPNEFIPWARVIKIDPDAVFVHPMGGGAPYPKFESRPGQFLVNAHLMGRTILDTDGRRIEVVNDVHFLESKGRMLTVHVDISFNGFLRKYGLERLFGIKDDLISWRYVKLFALEEMIATDRLSLSVTQQELRKLPSEDLADALEELSGQDQQALFSALDSEKAAETLVHVEPRAQRQLIASLRRERAQNILSEMSVPQLADLFLVLPHDEMVKMMELLSAPTAERIRAILSAREATARTLLSEEYLTCRADQTVGEVLRLARGSAREYTGLSYIYVTGKDNVVAGAADLRKMMLAPDGARMGEIMDAPPVCIEADDERDAVEELFARYHYRMLPVVDPQNRLLGVVRYKDVMRQEVQS